jgi:thiamine biosynthesis lipoprotein
MLNLAPILFALIILAPAVSAEMQSQVKQLFSTGVANSEMSASLEGDQCRQNAKVDTGYWWSDHQSIMGTDIRVELWHENGVTACAAIASVMREMKRIDRVMSPYIETSVLSQLNSKGAYRPVFVGRELFALIERSLYFSKVTDGAFDITYASAGKHYSFKDGKKPDDKTLAAAIDAIDYRNLQMDAKAQTIAFTRLGVSVDLGGIGKGYAVDRGIQILEALGISQAMVGAGGDSRIIGDRRGEPWVVGIRNPRSKQDNVAVLPLMDISVSTSGDYERFFEKEGVRYHHIIDPDTGDSAREVRSVTIIGAKAATTDALSTSVFVLGVKKGLALINEMEGFDAIVVDGKGQMFVSDSLLQMTAAR